MHLNLEELTYHSNPEIDCAPVLIPSKSKSNEKIVFSWEIYEELNGKKISEEKILKDLYKEMQKIQTTPIFEEENILSRLQV